MNRWDAFTDEELAWFDSGLSTVLYCADNALLGLLAEIGAELKRRRPEVPA